MVKYRAHLYEKLILQMVKYRAHLHKNLFREWLSTRPAYEKIDFVNGEAHGALACKSILRMVKYKAHFHEKST